MHADRGPWTVPSFGEQHCVHKHVDLAGLEVSQDASQLPLGRLAGDRLGLHPDFAEGLGDVVGVTHAGRVHDSRHAVEASLVEVGDRHVERRLIQQLGQHLLVELGVHLAATQRHLGDRPHARSGRDADAAQRRDHPTPGRLCQVET